MLGEGCEGSCLYLSLKASLSFAIKVNVCFGRMPRRDHLGSYMEFCYRVLGPNVC